DGNPNVTPEVTRQACLLGRWMAVDLYQREIDLLWWDLSMASGTDELHARAGETHEPYRAVLREVRRRLDGPRRWVESLLETDRGAEARTPIITGAGDAYVNVADLAEPLRLCDRSLRQTGNAVIAEGRLADLLRRVASFGLTLAR